MKANVEHSETEIHFRLRFRWTENVLRHSLGAHAHVPRGTGRWRLWRRRRQRRSPLVPPPPCSNSNNSSVMRPRHPLELIIMPPCPYSLQIVVNVYSVGALASSSCHLMLLSTTLRYLCRNRSDDGIRLHIHRSRAHMMLHLYICGMVVDLYLVTIKPYCKIPFSAWRYLDGIHTSEI